MRLGDLKVPVTLPYIADEELCAQSTRKTEVRNVKNVRLTRK